VKRTTAGGFWWDAWQTGIAAQTTIALRIWAFTLPGAADSAWGRAELLRMVVEKQQAMLDSGFAMQRTLLRATTTEAALPMLAAGLRPYRQKTQANAKRLARRV